MKYRKRTASDFVFKEELGHGSYSTVYKAIDKHDLKRVYAIKVCSKAHIIREAKVKYVTIEKNTLNLLARENHPGIVKLYYTFHDADNLYFALDFAAGGELLSLLHKYRTFNEQLSRHFTIQLIDTVEYIHSKGVIHRDLKPENVLLDKEGRLMITDFGAATTVTKAELDGESRNDLNATNSTSSFVGTAEYVSPELLLYNKCTTSSDIWALGCMIYQFLEGCPPFRGSNELKTFEKIVELDYTWNPNKYATNVNGNSNKNINPMIIDTVRKVLVIDDNERITISDLKREPWFNGIDWNNKFDIWKGIFTMDQSLLRDQSGLNMSDQQKRRMIPNRQLHVIDTPIKNITISKQKKKKPMKISTNTSSIVEWRKKLGISLNQNNEKTPATGLMTPNNDRKMVYHPQKIINQHSGSAPLANKKQQVLQTQHYQNSYPNGIQKASDINTTSQPMPQASLTAPPMERQLTNGNGPAIEYTPSLRSYINSNRGPSPPCTNLISLDASTPSGESPSNLHYSRQQQQQPETKYGSHILKQDFIYICEIPFLAVGPALSINSYNRIDNDLITDIVSKNGDFLKKSNTKPKLLTLTDKGHLMYSDDLGVNEHSIVDVSDSGLSMYDFEFDEAARKGFLILEKYKEKLWFISLPSATIGSQLHSTDINSISPIMNSEENWVDCFFRSRHLLEDDNLSNEMKTLNVDDNNSDENVYNHPSTSFVAQSLPVNTVSQPTYVSPTLDECEKKPLPSRQLVSPDHKLSPALRYNKKSSSSTTSGGHNNNINYVNDINTALYTSAAAVASKNALMNHLNKENKEPSSNLTYAPPSRRQTPLELGTAKEYKIHNRSQKPNKPPGSSLPTVVYPPEKKYRPPKNMIVTSSRREVLNTLNSASQRVGSDQSIASSGASAAFKSLQKRKNESTR
ncbi:similar to Saccharomyces cerevisiae YDR466W PKH3 Protein kinase with similarity to mammalian phosphoinositide-dependent kinase 1 (PDK1) and yeast Pkh1p and Pkh2p [Maudiozyma saulgeensis]|uniref:non-specific serine/threonine protein kinase n=1 Tax=Maudiozyma saulgeensis TaxID=1789683 RepID=A0A1X7R9F6_9SACH|nr:similar to Saccharomyces cerevisiae YDR466W PKH3 Protein kinase with similarity to mammalian phosphoinositide-dependent kinase 1 (PDK1) and yeast Pkh1p and Pkh2p [Kazachstania saulgeensis]